MHFVAGRIQTVERMKAGEMFFFKHNARELCAAALIAHMPSALPPEGGSLSALHCTADCVNHMLTVRGPGPHNSHFISRLMMMNMFESLRLGGDTSSLRQRGAFRLVRGTLADHARVRYKLLSHD